MDGGDQLKLVRWMDEKMCGCLIYGRADGWLNIDGWLNGLMDKSMGGLIDGWTNGDGWLKRWIDN